MSSSSEAEFDDDKPLSKLSSNKVRKPATSIRVPKPEDVPSSSTSRTRKHPAKKRINYDDDANGKSNDNDSDDDFIVTKKKKRKTTPPTSSSSTSTSTSSFTATKNGSKRKATTSPTKTRVKKENGSAKSNGSKSTKLNGSKSTKASTNKTKKELKKLEKADRIAHAMQSFLWWDAKEPPEGCQWVTMEHAGVSFTEKYDPHGVKMQYDGKDVDLSPAEEEA